MTPGEKAALWVQVAAVIAAVAASIIALVVSAKDRRNSRQIAAEDRRAALLQAKLMFELEALTRLAQNLRRGGHSDTEISRDMGAEAGALIGALGRDRLPLNWDKRVNQTDEELRRFVTDDSKMEWVRRSAEAQVALNAVSNELGELIQAESAKATGTPR